MSLNGLEKGYAFRIFGLSEKSLLEEITSALPEDLAELVTVTESCLDARVAVSDNATLAQKKQIIFKLFSRFSANVYSEIDEDLSFRAFRLLMQRGLKLGVAESLTGGLLVSEIIKYPGASKVVSEGIVAYSNDAKHLRLDVYPEILREHGAVSAQTARAMVEGLLARQYNDVAVSTTGYADATDEYTPAGLVYVGVGVPRYVETYKFNFKGTRDEVRKCAVNAGLFYLIKLLKADFHPEDYKIDNN